MDLDGVGDAGSPALRVRHPDAVPGLDQAEFDPFAAEGDDAVGPDVEADRGIGDLNLHLPAGGIDPADDPVYLHEMLTRIRSLHRLLSSERDPVSAL